MAWVTAGDSAVRLIEELRREVGPDHPLFGTDVVALARRQENDDVLIAVSDTQQPFAVVHLTWSSNPEPLPYPVTTFLTS